jgi:predicted RNA-binding Zn-ribbon protein involved in translation (DUF1610 family)
MNNTELIKALRYCGNFADRDGCDEECPYFNDKDCPKRIMCDAADALEAAYEMIDDCVAAIDALDDSNDAYIKENERIKKQIAELEAQLPKEGEWQWLSSTYDRVPREMRYWCSVCHHEEITHNDKPWKHYCPNCGAKMDGERKDGERDGES